MSALLLALALLASAGGAGSAAGQGRGAGSDSAAMVARVRAAQTAMFMEWRKIWMSSYNDGHLAPLRLAAVHCHHDGSYSTPAPNLIRSLYTSRSMCPIWYAGSRSNPDERTGRDMALPENARARARALREPVLALLDSAASILPRDRFIAGQRVRLYLDHGDLAGASSAAGSCRVSESWCALLRGLVLHRRGLTAAADSVFQTAMPTMSWDERCAWNDISELFEEADRRRFRAYSCDAREALVERFWWLSDPLHSEPWNERRAEHFARRLVVQLHRDLTIDERWDWNDDHGADAIAETLIRYGWPSFVGWGGAWEDRGHFQWLGFTDSSVNVSAEYVGVRVRAVPPLAPAIDSFSIVEFEDPDLSPRPSSRVPFVDTRWWAPEHFARGAGPIVRLSHQRALFRRENDALIFVAVEGMDLPASATSDVMIVSRGPESLVRSEAASRTAVSGAVAVRGAGSARLFSGRQPQGKAIVSVELVARDTGAASGRARFGADFPRGLAGFPRDSVALSDILLFAPAPGHSSSASVEAVAGSMLGSTSMRGVRRLGIFWEMYGVRPQDSVDVAIRITQIDEPGFLRRVGQRLGLVGRGGASVLIRWTEPQSAEAGAFVAGSVPVQSRSLVTDISRLGRGQYVIELTIRCPGGGSATSLRAMETGGP